MPEIILFPLLLYFWVQSLIYVAGAFLASVFLLLLLKVT